jgi:hypothetical protein
VELNNDEIALVLARLLELSHSRAVTLEHADRFQVIPNRSNSGTAALPMLDELVYRVRQALREANGIHEGLWGGLAAKERNGRLQIAAKRNRASAWEPAWTGTVRPDASTTTGHARHRRSV